MDYDLIVIGGGTAGINAAKGAHKRGPKIAIVEFVPSLKNDAPGPR